MVTLLHSLINREQCLSFISPSFSFMFDVSIFRSTIIKQKGSSVGNWTGKVFYKEMFVKSIKSN